MQFHAAVFVPYGTRTRIRDTIECMPPSVHTVTLVVRMQGEGEGRVAGRTIKQGDVVGCGVQSGKHGELEAWFTVNGDHAGTAKLPYPVGAIYPVVALSGRGESVRVVLKTTALSANMSLEETPR